MCELPRLCGLLLLPSLSSLETRVVCTFSLASGSASLRHKQLPKAPLSVALSEREKRGMVLTRALLSQWTPGIFPLSSLLHQTPSNQGSSALNGCACFTKAVPRSPSFSFAFVPTAFPAGRPSAFFRFLFLSCTSRARWRRRVFSNGPHIVPAESSVSPRPFFRSSKHSSLLTRHRIHNLLIRVLPSFSSSSPRHSSPPGVFWCQLFCHITDDRSSSFSPCAVRPPSQAEVGEHT